MITIIICISLSLLVLAFLVVQHAGRKPKLIPGELVFIQEKVYSRITRFPYFIIVSIAISDTAFGIYFLGRPLVLFTKADCIGAEIKAGSIGGSFERYPRTKSHLIFHPGPVLSLASDYVKTFLQKEAATKFIIQPKKKEKPEEAPVQEMKMELNNLEELLKRSSYSGASLPDVLNHKKIRDQMQIIAVGGDSHCLSLSQRYVSGGKIEIDHMMCAKANAGASSIHDLASYRSFFNSCKEAIEIKIILYRGRNVLKCSIGRPSRLSYYIDIAEPDTFMKTLNSFAKWTLIEIVEIMPGPSMCPM